MQKRILSILLCLVLALSLAACGTVTENPTDGSVGGSITGDSVDASNSSSSETNTDSLTDPSSGTVTDSVTDVLSSDSSEFSDLTDMTDDVVDVAPGGDDLGGGNQDASDSSGSSDYIPEDTSGSSTDGGDWWEDTNSGTTTPESDSSVSSDQNTDSSDTSEDESEKVDVTEGRKFLATDITNHGIVVFNLDACNGDYQKLTDDSVSVFWEWTYADDVNATMRGPGYGIDSAKLRYSAYYEKDVVIACSSGGWAGIIDYENRTLLWESNATEIANAHSIEMLPNGDVVVASSQVATNGKPGLTYFALSSGSQTPTHTIISDSAHGVSWDPANECLWVLNNKEIYAVKVQNPGRNGTLQVVEGSAVGGFAGGHALSPVTGSPGKYWVGANSTIFQFDTKTKTLTKCADVLQQPGIKGIASFADGTVILAAHKIGGGTPTYGWSSDGFRIVSANGTSVTVPFDTDHREFYKVQPFTRDYQ
ncbi:MAG: hypothetical protein J6B86_02515 [Clostridia bacterium]|nr:hypothetical protein [Clostridia bacterium]